MLVAVEDGARYEPDGTEVTYSVLIDDETGEVVYEGVPPATYGVAVLVQRRHDARAQEAAWESIKKALDAALLRAMRDQEQEVVEAESVVARIQRSSRRHTDSLAFSADLREAEVPRGYLLDIIAAASGFDRGGLPEGEICDMYDRRTEIRQSNPYIISRPIRRRAPGGAK